LGLLVLLIVIAAILYFVFVAGDDEGTDETPAPEETTSMWQGEPGASLLLADAGRDVAPVLILRSA
jgi:hypothetical protein